MYVCMSVCLYVSAACQNRPTWFSLQATVCLQQLSLERNTSCAFARRVGWQIDTIVSQKAASSIIRARDDNGTGMSANVHLHTNSVMARRLLSECRQQQSASILYRRLLSECRQQQSASILYRRLLSECRQQQSASILHRSLNERFNTMQHLTVQHSEHFSCFALLLPVTVPKYGRLF
jgi:hypothetical protein